jgi:hypothetical protein
VRITWSSVSGADQYRVYRNTNNSSTGRTLLGNAPASPYDDLTAVPGITYYYWVTAVGAGGESAFSIPDTGRRANPTTGTTLGITAPTTPISSGMDTFCLDILVAQSPGLGAFEFELTFPPALLQGISVSESNFLGSTGRTVIPIANEIDNNAGAMTLAVASTGSQDGPTGDGALAEICFSPQAAGNVTLQFNSWQLTDEAGAIIPTTATPQSFTISDCYWADLDCDGQVRISDIQLVASRWGTAVGDANYNPAYDFDNDGDIDILDVQQIAAQWGWPTHAVASTTTVNTPIVFALNPAELDLSLGRPAVVALQLQDAVGVAAFETAVQFDPTLLRVDAVTLGDFLSSTGRTPFPVGPEIDNVAGIVSFGTATFGNAPGASGTGTVAYLHITPLAVGEGALTLADMVAGDVNGAGLAATAVPAHYTIAEQEILYLPLVIR